MARPRKEGLEYFSLDIDIDQDDKLVVPIAKYGNRGFGIIVRLLQEIYRNGYFYSWSEKDQYVFAMKVNEDIGYIQELVSECINWGFFHGNMYLQYQILTSKGIQKRFIFATSKRVGTAIRTEYDLVTDQKKVSAPETPPKQVVSESETIGLCVNESAESTQSIVKNSIEKESKEKEEVEEVEEETAATDSDVYRFYENNFGQMTGYNYQQVDKWIEDMNADVVILAMQNALDHNVRNWMYVNNTLSNWFNKNARTVEQCKAAMIEFESNKAKNKQPQGQQRFNRGQAQKPSIQIIQDAPKQTITAEELEEMRKMARKLDGKED